MNDELVVNFYLNADDIGAEDEVCEDGWQMHPNVFVPPTVGSMVHVFTSRDDNGNYPYEDGVARNHIMSGIVEQIIYHYSGRGSGSFNFHYVTFVDIYVRGKEHVQG